MISPEAARLILNRWQEEATTLWVTASLFGLSVDTRCRVTDVREGELILDSLDGVTRLVVDLADPELQFSYAEPRSHSGSEEIPERERFLSAVTLGLSRRVRISSVDDIPAEREKVFLMELPM